ncbi:uncharacterized protein MICPUCDRAFT_5018, partial [Micromonas pusilla CCMP1545]
WSDLARAAATVDVLASFASFAATHDGPTCRPTFVDAEGGGATLELENVWHPCAVAGGMLRGRAGAGGTSGIVPNDVVLGDVARETPRAMLLTGANMGGKSTLATCVAVVLAHAGALAPASRCVLSPVDVVFTRLGGAGDRVATGESTFLVECAEAAVILREATPSSLVVVDELGRGTSTFDGYSVAFAAFKKLALGVGCRTMFATHFHGLAREFRASPDVQLAHMAATVADAGGGEDDARGGGGGSAIASAAAPAPPPITFLYKLRPGACPKSYGVRVAALAAVPKEVLK